MKLGKKIGAAGLAVVLSAGVITAGGYAGVANAEEIKVTNSKHCSSFINIFFDCETPHFGTKGVEKVTVTVKNASDSNGYFTIREDVKNFQDDWAWSNNANTFVFCDIGIGCGASDFLNINDDPNVDIHPGETKSFVVQTNATQSAIKKAVQGVYVLGSAYSHDGESIKNSLQVTFSRG